MGRYGAGVRITREDNCVFIVMLVQTIRKTIVCTDNKRGQLCVSDVSDVSAVRPTLVQTIRKTILCTDNKRGE